MIVEIWWRLYKPLQNAVLEFRNITVFSMSLQNRRRVMSCLITMDSVGPHAWQLRHLKRSEEVAAMIPNVTFPSAHFGTRNLKVVPSQFTKKVNRMIEAVLNSGRNPRWCKVRYIQEAFSSFLSCGIIFYMDSDVTIVRPFHVDHSMQTFLNSLHCHVFVSREPNPGIRFNFRNRFSVTDDVFNTRVNTGFIGFKRSYVSEILLHNWWTYGPRRYHRSWPFDQGVFDLLLKRRENSRHIKLSTNPCDFNCPNGWFATHLWGLRNVEL